VSKSIVINTSPWIALSLCNQTSLLNQLYSQVLMPTTVKDEILVGGKKGVGVKELNVSGWLYELEKGEAEVIVLAIEKGIKLVLIDEKIARLQAKVLNLDVIGTLGLLLKAKKRRLIENIKPLISSIVEGGYWTKEDIIEGILKAAGE